VDCKRGDRKIVIFFASDNLLELGRAVDYYPPSCK
jgi:hypothetical protein